MGLNSIGRRNGLPPKPDAPVGAAPTRVLSRHETHDLGMIIKDRGKVLLSHAEEQAAACLADFEKKMAAIYSYDQDDVWKAATAAAIAAVTTAQAQIEKRCKELGIPKSFAPSVAASWQGRGENAITSRRSELRRVAKTAIDAMLKAAKTRIEKQSLELRTQVIGLGIYSPAARMFLESLAPIEDSMHSLDFVEMERKLETEKENRRIGHYGSLGDL